MASGFGESTKSSSSPPLSQRDGLEISFYLKIKTITLIGISQLDGGPGAGKSHWAELTPEFQRKHYLVGLVLSHLSNAFNHV